MGDSWDKFKDSAYETGKAVSDVVNELFEKGKEKAQECSLKNEMREQFKTLGILTYNAAKKGENIEEKVAKVIARIDEIKEELEDQKL